MTYNFTRLNAVKPGMIGESIADARRAAEQFAHDSGAAVGGIRSATQGYFSITARDGDVDTEGGGGGGRLAAAEGARGDDDRILSELGMRGPGSGPPAAPRPRAWWRGWRRPRARRRCRARRRPTGGRAARPRPYGRRDPRCAGEQHVCRDRLGASAMAWPMSAWARTRSLARRASAAERYQAKPSDGARRQRLIDVLAGDIGMAQSDLGAGAVRARPRRALDRPDLARPKRRRNPATRATAGPRRARHCPPAPGNRRGGCRRPLRPRARRSRKRVPAAGQSASATKCEAEAFARRRAAARVEPGIGRIDRLVRIAADQSDALGHAGCRPVALGEARRAPDGMAPAAGSGASDDQGGWLGGRRARGKGWSQSLIRVATVATSKARSRSRDRRWSAVLDQDRLHVG